MSHFTKRLLASAGLIVVAVTVAACGHERTEQESSGSDTTTTQKSASTELTPGTIGDLKNICSPGDAKGTTARGVTDSSIKVSTVADAGAALVPGLDQEFFDASDAFVKWCNEAGGINGRKIVLVKRDAQMFSAAKVTIDACQSDFMMVGGAPIIDEPSVKPRVKCGLGTIAAFALSTEAADAPLQVVPADSGNARLIGMFRLLAKKYPDAIKHFGTGSPDVPSTIDTTRQQAAGAAALGYKLVDFQKYPIQVDDWRPYIQRSQKAGVEMLQPTAQSLVLQPYVQAMNDVGYEPDAMVMTAQFYVPQVIDAAKNTKFPPSWVGINMWPLEMADQNPGTAQAVAMIKDAVPKARINYAHIQSLDTWLLWAKSAKACGSDLTVKCVIDKAGSEKNWTAAGLWAPVNTDPKLKEKPECFVMMKVTKDGFQYDKDITQPNNRIYNCDPKNLASVNVEE